MTQLSEQFYSGGKVFLAILITTVFSGLAVYFLLDNSVARQKEELGKAGQLMQEKINDLQSKLEEATIASGEKKDTAINLDYKFENSKEFTPAKPFFIDLKNGEVIFLNEKAEKKLTDNKEIITSFYSPLVPKSKNLVFISVHISGTPTTTFNKVYTYNLKNGELNTIYREQKYRVLRSIGFSDNKLIMFSDLKLNRDFKCFSPWSENYPLVYLNIGDLSQPLETYKAPESKIIEARKIQMECF